MSAGLVALCLSRGSGPVLLGNHIALWLSGGIWTPAVNGAIQVLVHSASSQYMIEPYCAMFTG